jgi:hypothetical protein
LGFVYGLNEEEGRRSGENNVVRTLSRQRFGEEEEERCLMGGRDQLALRLAAGYGLNEMLNVGGVVGLRGQNLFLTGCCERFCWVRLLAENFCRFYNFDSTT